LLRQELAGQLYTAVWKETGGKFIFQDRWVPCMKTMVIEECSCVNAFKGTYFEFVRKTTWSDEASFKLRGTMNRHKWIYW